MEVCLDIFFGCGTKKSIAKGKMVDLAFILFYFCRVQFFFLV